MKRICLWAVLLCLIVVEICGCGNNAVVEENEPHDNLIENNSGIEGSEEVLKQYSDINWVTGSRLTASQSEVATWTKSLTY